MLLCIYYLNIIYLSFDSHKALSSEEEDTDDREIFKPTVIISTDEEDKEAKNKEKPKSPATRSKKRKYQFARKSTGGRRAMQHDNVSDEIESQTVQRRQLRRKVSTEKSHQYSSMVHYVFIIFPSFLILDDSQWFNIESKETYSKARTNH